MGSKHIIKALETVFLTIQILKLEQNRHKKFKFTDFFCNTYTKDIL